MQNIRKVILVSVLLVVFSSLLLAGQTPDKVSEDPEAAAVIWSFNTGAAVYGTPLIHNNIVYIGSGDKNLYALDAFTGEEIWHYKAGSAVRSTAAIDSDVVCFESGNILYGLDLDGNQLWTFDLYTSPLDNVIDNWDYFHSSPTVHEGVAYLGSVKGLLYGVDTHTGEQVLKIEAPITDNAIRTTPAIYNNKIYFGDWDGRFYAYDINSGERVWMYNSYPERLWNGGLPAIQTNPAIYNGAVHFSGRGCIFYALDAETGEKIWQHNSPTNEWLLGGPALVDSVFYLGSSNQKMLQAINANTGEVIWKSVLGDGRIFGTAQVWNDHIYVGSGYDDPYKGAMWVLDKDTGAKLNKFSVGHMVQSSPVLVDSILYFGSGNGTVYALDAEKTCNIPRPEINVNANPVIIGDVENSNANFDTSITVYNTGMAPDSLSIRWSGAFIPKSAITIEPATCQVPANDSIQIKVRLDATQFNTGTSVFTVLMGLKYSLFKSSCNTTIKVNIVDVSSVEQEGTLFDYALAPNYPNPFNPETKISFSVPRITDVNISVYNLSGKLVETLFADQSNPGNYTIAWNGKSCASGTYFIKMEAGDFQQISKCLLLK